ncbi:MAG: histidine ammonia-lyase, partial [Flavobacteriales bacterium]
MSSDHHIIQTSEKLTLARLRQIIVEKKKLVLSAEARESIEKCRLYMDNKLDRESLPIYGINTGFGSLCNTRIDDSQLELLQRNLLLSHACGMGEEVPQTIVKLMLLLKIQGLSHGHSAVQVATVERLIDFYNNDILPVVYQQGSLGASGDLAPLAHLSIPLLGEGEVYFKGKRMKSSDALKQTGLEPIRLKSKEGLALINGTQFMSAYASWCLMKSESLIETGAVIAAMSIDGYDARPEPFEHLTHAIRPHAGQIKAAKMIRDILVGSEIQIQAKQEVQDPYSFRCIPQVHGASLDAVDYVRGIVETEINSVTDNPIVFPDEDRIISGGNFHGQPLALSLDFLCIALAELGSISERRTYKLIGGKRGLDPYLIKDAGLNSGFMIPQYTAASIVSQNKQLCTPSSVDTIDSSNGQEDHVSMGANAATKCFRVVENLHSILAIECINAAQALDFR